MLICDLSREELTTTALIVSDFDVIYGAEELTQASACHGCFGCWVRTPGHCVRHDVLGGLGEQIAQVSELVIVSRLTWGGHSELVKRAIDRILPYLHCDFEVHAGRMRHRMRHEAPDDAPAGAHFRVTAWFWGPSTADERACAQAIARANANNWHAEVSGIWFPREPAGIGNLKNAPVTSENPRQNWPAHRPHSVGLASLSPRRSKSTSQLLLDDLAEATRAYEKQGHLQDGELRLIGLADPKDAANVDAIVLALPLYVDELPSNAIAELVRIGAVTRPGAHIYALLNCGFYEPEQTDSAFKVLELWCRAHNLAWSGGVAIGGGGMMPAIWGTPRLGWFRRPVSEAIDELILALRSGRDAGSILVRQRIPRWAYILAAQAGWCQQARANGTSLGPHTP